MTRRTVSKMQQRIAALNRRKNDLEFAIMREVNKPQACEMAIRHLKKLRLMLKDELHEIRRWAINTSGSAQHRKDLPA